LLRADLADATFVAAVNTGNSFAPRIAAHRESRGATAGPFTAHLGPCKQEFQLCRSRVCEDPVADCSFPSPSVMDAVGVIPHTVGRYVKPVVANPAAVRVAAPTEQTLAGALSSALEAYAWIIDVGRGFNVATTSVAPDLSYEVFR